MSVATLTPEAPARAVKTVAEQRMLIRDVDWRTYVILRELLDRPSLKMTYCEGALELMTPSHRHEAVKKNWARLLETFALELDVPLNGYGGPTLRREEHERGLEPDECYCLRRIMEDGQFPDIAIEVVVTQPLLDKLDIYERFKVQEVWTWQDGRSTLFARRENAVGKGSYEEIPASELVPELDFQLLAEYVESLDQHAAVREYRDRLRAAAGS
jgi:Uma2 family endonuclease